MKFLSLTKIRLAFLGFSSGINYASIGASLTLLLNDFNVAYALMGFFSLRMIPFSFKALWAPIIELLPIKFINKGYAPVISRLIICQFTIICGYLLLAKYADPTLYLRILLILSIFIAIIASIYDISLHEFRIKAGGEEKHANAIVGFSFNSGFITSLSCGLLLSQHFPWAKIYLGYALFLIPGLIVLLCAYNPNEKHFSISVEKSVIRLKKGYLIPFLSLFRKKHIWAVIIIAIFFKASDAFMNNLLMPYLLKVGFSKQDILTNNKLLEYVSHSLGVYAFVRISASSINKIKFMIIAEMFAACSNLAFIIFSYYPNTILLTMVSFIEGAISSMCNVAMIFFMTSFAKNSRAFATSFYIFLESLALLGRVVIASFAGVAVENMGWSGYLVLSTLLSIPTILACLYLSKNKPNFI
jgi:PAT family beta-lactamase induction signal transducer AmpG